MDGLWLNDMYVCMYACEVVFTKKIENSDSWSTPKLTTQKFHSLRIKNEMNNEKFPLHYVPAIFFSYGDKFSRFGFGKSSIT
jgi:hypothetical protein